MDSRGFIQALIYVEGLLEFAWVHSGTPRVRRVHSGSRRFSWEVFGVSGFIRVCVDLPYG